MGEWVPKLRDLIATILTGSEIEGPYWGPYQKGILLFGGSILGVPYFRKLPCGYQNKGAMFHIFIEHRSGIDALSKARLKVTSADGGSVYGSRASQKYYFSRGFAAGGRLLEGFRVRVQKGLRTQGFLAISGWTWALHRKPAH